MKDLCDLQVHVNGQHTFFLNERIVSRFSGKLRKTIKQEKRKTQIRNSGICIDDFPGGADGFELVSRFCYDNGRIGINVSNVCLLHSCSVFLGMTERVAACNLLQQTETFLEGIFSWSWNEILIGLKSCEPFFAFADASGLLEKLMCSLLAKIAQNSDMSLLLTSSSSNSSSSPETAASGFRHSSSAKNNTPELFRPCSSSKAWWFEDLTILPPNIIERFVKTVGAYGNENNSSVLTRFLLHYLKTAVQGKTSRSSFHRYREEYSGLADTAVYGVILMGKTSFSCRALLWVLKLVSGLGLSRNCRAALEKHIGGILDQASLDDLLVSGHDDGGGGGVYDVNLVVRLIRVFVHNDKVTVQRIKKLGKLVDKYLGEISPDPNLKISKFLGVSESLPDFARDSFDGVYRAIDIYLESHPTLSLEERSRLCRCLNYEKLSLEACKDLAKNPRIPPRVTVQALASQHSNILTRNFIENPSTQMVLHNSRNSNMSSSTDPAESCSAEETHEMRLNLQSMQWRVVELENVCREMKGQMSRISKGRSVISPAAAAYTRTLPRLC